jgi:hypothetical protein
MSIRELLGFQKGAPKQVHEHGGTLEGFWSMITREAHQQRNSIQNPIIQVFHSWMCKRILGRMRETKITDMEVNWLCSALIARQPIDPTHLNDQPGCCGNIGFGRYWLGLLPLHIGYLFETGITRNPEHLLAGTSLGFEYMKQGKNISGDERGGF